MMNNKTRQALKQRLLDEKEHLESQINRENQEIVEQSLDQANENTYSNHMADDGGYLQDIDRTTTIRQSLMINLKQVNRALELMEAGTYGLSEVSGKEIPVERLEALPWATTLVDETE